MMRSFKAKFLATLAVCLIFSSPSQAFLINGTPAKDFHLAVGMFNNSCTLTKVGEKQFLTAAHCISRNYNSLYFSFLGFQEEVKIRSINIHPSWVKDCSKQRCTGHEVGSDRMTPGRADVALINLVESTPLIPIYNISFNSVKIGSKVTMVGAGCTRGIEPGGPGEMRSADTRTVSHKFLEHEDSLYRKNSKITGKANLITLGYDTNKNNASLCPGDSGGPLVMKNASDEWEVVGIAADYTFNGPYIDGNLTVTNLHTRLDNESYLKVGSWIRSVWDL
jgi:hypothetical protein